MKRNKHSLSNTKLLSCDMGQLIPCGLTEVLPGDTVQQATSALVRASPMLAPVMHPVDVRIHHWFVPMRLIWEDWEDFITGGPDGTSLPAFPYIDLGGNSASVGGLFDYLGIPTGVTGLEFSALPLRAYQLIYNENYRDQDLVTAAPISIASGQDSTTSWSLQNCSWEKDYFTSARPFEQKGPAITIPIGTSAPVKGIGVTQATNPQETTPANMRETGSPASPGVSYANAWNAQIRVKADQAGASAVPQVFADLTGVSSVTVNLLREALALQRFEEARARYGSRYVEYLRYLGVRSSDARLQRPEYLGGGKQRIQFSEVLQTAADGTNPTGTMRGHGIGAMRSNRYRRYFEEHGYVVSLLSVKPKTIYAQGLPRTYNRRVKEDFWQVELQHIGQQEILKKEVYAASADPDGTFGWQDRYDEYRRQESTIAGEFRSSLLNFWHMARIFASEPALNDTFVVANPTDRIFAVPSQHNLYVMVNHSIQARRLVAKTGSSFIY